MNPPSKPPSKPSPAAAPVRCESRGPVYWITIDRAERRNAINDDVARGIADGLRAAEAQPGIRAVVLTGAGDKAFCAGGDLQAGPDDSPFESDPARLDNAILDLFRTFEQCGLPTIARVNGHALAGGLGLMCACDLAIAVETATFGVPESGVGLFPMMILPYLLRAMPRRRLLEWCITGARFTAAEALEAELVNRVVPAADLDRELDALLAQIATRSPTAIRLGKRGLRAIEHMTLAQAFEYAGLMLPNMARTEDAREGFRAFREKRSPSFSGR
ncbi:MAG: enoyl-CoA hydratase/isomerase family protein [Deltaproteobacteria bacterium]|nr:enoyl-CoA hydratase/isomerase family protein [Deltaproteobacteria bacterium]